MEVLAPRHCQFRGKASLQCGGPLRCRHGVGNLSAVIRRPHEQYCGALVTRVDACVSVVLASRPQLYNRGMPYPYEDLDSTQFERLIVQCGKKLFGAGMQGFSPGKDGGRDALFHGTAERHPSTASPWIGKTVVQAKHTSGLNAHFSDPEFSVNKSSTLSDEIPRIKALIADGMIDNYMLIANRRLGGVSGPNIIRHISQATGLTEQSIYLGGIEYLDDLILEYPSVVTMAKIDGFTGPLVVSSDDLAEVILAVADHFSDSATLTDLPTVDRTEYEEKSKLNNMTDEFAALLADKYLVETESFSSFLAAPGNRSILGRYSDTVEEFQLKIVAKRKDFETFDDVFNRIYDLLISRDPVLRRHKRLTRAMLFYMYWNCDIGRSKKHA